MEFYKKLNFEEEKISNVEGKKNLKEKNSTFEKKNIFFCLYVTHGFLYKKISQFYPAVWPAIANMYIFIFIFIYKHINERRA